MRIAHTMIRVTDLDRSLHFYTSVLGMTLRDRLDFPEGRFTPTFVGFGDESGASTLELTHNWDTQEYELGNAFGHLALEVDDVRAAVEEIRARGGTIMREPKAAGVRPLLTFDERLASAWRAPNAGQVARSASRARHRGYALLRGGRRGGRHRGAARQLPGVAHRERAGREQDDRENGVEGGRDRGGCARPVPDDHVQVPYPRRAEESESSATPQAQHRGPPAPCPGDRQG